MIDLSKRKKKKKKFGFTLSFRCFNFGGRAYYANSLTYILYILLSPLYLYTFIDIYI